MWSKFNDIFSRKKTRFKETIKKEKRRFYMFNKKSTNFYCKRKKNKAFQLKINFDFNKKIILYIFLFGIFFSVLGISYILKGEYFSIKNIRINIQDGITNETIVYKAVDSIRNKSIFLENKKNISQKLIDYQKNINTIKIEKILPDTLIIDIESFPIVMNVIYNEKKYSLTSNGVLIPYKKIHKNDEIFLINIINSKKEKYKIFSYKKIFNDDLIYTINSLIKSFKNNILSHNIENIDFFNDEREIHITVKNKTIFIFSIEDNIEEQLKKLMVYTKEKNNSLKYVYIDLRIKHKIFICSYEKEYQCLKNYKRIYSKNN